MKVLRLKAVGAAMHPHLAAHEGGARRYVGRQYDSTIGHEIKATNGTVIGHAGGWPAIEDGEELSCDPEHFAEYKAAVLAGDLEPADAESAALLGVALSKTAPLAAHEDIADHAEKY